MLNRGESRRLPGRRHLLPLGLYTLVTLVLSYPVATNLTGQIPGGGDGFWFLWDLWWFKQAILAFRQSPLVTRLIYYPLNDAPVQWQSPVNELFAAPLQAATGVVLEYNLLWLASFVLTAYFTYLLLRVIVRRRDLAFVGGLIFGFCSYRWTRGFGHLSLLTTQWLPLAVLLVINLARRPSVGRGVAAGVGIALVALSSPYYLADFLLPLGLVGAGYLVIARRDLLGNPAWRKGALAMALVAGAATLPFYVSSLMSKEDMASLEPMLRQSAYVFGADLLSWVLPPGWNPFWGKYTGPIYGGFTTPSMAETTVFFGFLPPILALATVFMRWPGQARVRFWQAAALLTFLLAFGPALHVGGETVVSWMPYRLLMALPGFESFRVPSRMGVTTVLAGTVLALLLVKRLLAGRKGWQWTALLGVWSVCLLFNMTFKFPYLVSSTQMPAAYAALASEEGGGALLELPAGERYLDPTSRYMYYQTAHEQPLVSGYLGRVPARLTQPEHEMAFVKRFFSNETRYGVALPTDRELTQNGWPEEVTNAAGILQTYGIERVQLHCALAKPFCGEAARLLNAGLGFPMSRQDDVLVYPVKRSEGAGAAYAVRGGVSALVRMGGPALCAAGDGAAPDTAGTVEVALPLAGRWTITGEVRHAGTAPQVMFDGAALTATYAYSKTLEGFSIEQKLDTGAHRLTLSNPVDAGQAPCVQGMIARWEGASGADARPIGAEFANEQGVSYRLDSAQVVTVPQAPGRLALLTAWHVQQPSGRPTLPGDAPDLYVHVTDAAGNILGQADHELAWQSQWAADGSFFYDIVALPDAAENSEAMLRVGLWFPARDSHYWVTDQRLVDAGNRLVLGAIKALSSENGAAK